MKMDNNNKHTEAVRRILQTQNYYEILGVRVKASTHEIAAAYKKLALLLHPDKNTDKDATKAFQILGNAKEVLMDKPQRAQYDKTHHLNKSTNTEKQKHKEEHKKRQQAKNTARTYSEANKKRHMRRRLEAEMKKVREAEEASKRNAEEFRKRCLQNMFGYLL